MNDFQKLLDAYNSIDISKDIIPREKFGEALSDCLKTVDEKLEEYDKAYANVVKEIESLYRRIEVLSIMIGITSIALLVSTVVNISHL